MRQMKMYVVFILLGISGVVSAQELGLQLGINSNNLGFNTELFDVIPLITDVDQASDIFEIGDVEDGISLVGDILDLRTVADFGYNIGLTYEYDINDIFAVQVAGLISKKGYKARVDLIGSLVRGEVDIDLMYFDIPLNLKYKIDLGNDKNMYLSAGPYFSYGFSAKEKMGVKVLGFGGGLETDLIWGGNTDLIKRADYGAVAGVGIDLGKVDLGLQYRLGLANMNPIDVDGFELRQQTLSVNVGYKF